MNTRKFSGMWGTVALSLVAGACASQPPPQAVECEDDRVESPPLLGAGAGKEETKLMVDELRMPSLPGAQLAAVQKSPACPDGVCPGLGNSFYLPEVNVYSQQTGGKSFFKDRALGKCAQLSKVEYASRQFDTANSVSEFVSNVSTSTDVSGSYRTMAMTANATVSATTGVKSTSTSALHSAALDINVVTHTVDFQQSSDCFALKNLDRQLLSQFKSLAKVDPKQVASAASWSSYVEFLKLHGSHIMMQQQIGSRLRQWESTTESTKDIQKTLEAKACAQVEGVSPGGGWSAKGCAAYSKEEREKALKQTSKSMLVIQGGTEKSRAALTKEVTKETLNQFVDSAERGSQQIRMVYKPIWQLFAQIFTPACASGGLGSEACDNLQRAYTLQAAYEGWLAVGCSEEKDGAGHVYQRMAISGTTTQGIQTYKCLVDKTGCRSDSSCSVGGSGLVCYCYGKDCIDAGPGIAGTSMRRDQVRGNQSGSYKSGVNNSCYFKAFKGCKCDKKWSGGLPQRTLYEQAAP